MNTEWIDANDLSEMNCIYMNDLILGRLESWEIFSVGLFESTKITKIE